MQEFILDNGFVLQYNTAPLQLMKLEDFIMLQFVSISNKDKNESELLISLITNDNFRSLLIDCLKNSKFNNLDITNEIWENEDFTNSRYLIAASILKISKIFNIDKKKNSDSTITKIANQE